MPHLNYRKNKNEYSNISQITLLILILHSELIWTQTRCKIPPFPFFSTSPRHQNICMKDSSSLLINRTIENNIEEE